MTNTLKHKYHSQHNTAKCRGIEWQFTFETWLAWWGDDIVNRGKQKGQLVMARIGDVGPYHPDNVCKKTCGENIIEANNGKSKPKISAALKGRINGPHSAETRAKISAGVKKVIQEKETTP
jgi:hypothetical protein